MLIFILGNSLLSAENSSLVSEKIAIYFYNHFDLSFEFVDFHVIIRKSAHFFEYAILGLFVMHILRLLKIHPILCLILCTVICSGISIFDEWVQSFQIGRTKLTSDCLIDIKGVLFGAVVYYVIYLIKKLLSKK